MAIAETDTEVHTPFEQDFEKDVAATQRYFDSSRFAGIIRLYTARQVVEQRGTIPVDHIVAREAAGAFYERLRELFAARKSITTFGPYSPGQAVSMKRMGIEAIYLGGWATSAKGSSTEDPGPDLDEAADQVAYVRIAAVAGAGVGDDKRAEVVSRCRRTLSLAHLQA